MSFVFLKGTWIFGDGFFYLFLFELDEVFVVLGTVPKLGIKDLGEFLGLLRELMKILMPVGVDFPYLLFLNGTQFF